MSRKRKDSAKESRGIAVPVAFAVVISLVVVMAGYLMDFYTAEAIAYQALEDGNGVEVTALSGEVTMFCGSDEDEGETRGLVFYPGAKVQVEAYAPLCRAIAEQGWRVYLVEMPFNMAVFDIDAAQDIIKADTEVERWYVGGHSMGGAMASTFASTHANELEGVVLFAAFSSEKLPDALWVLSIYGSQDKVLNKGFYDSCFANLPAATSEIVIEGGNHSQFGSYGHQNGDGDASISAESQREAVAKILAAV